MTISDDTLMAYVDGELDTAAVAELERALADDAQLAQRVAKYLASQRQLRARLREAFDPVRDEPVPPALLQVARSAALGPAEVIALPARATRTAPRRWLALAASLVIGVMLGATWFRGGGNAAVVMQDGRLLADAGLRSALEQQPVATQGDAGSVQIGFSFRARDGRYCRSFTLRGRQAMGGYACHEPGAWSVQALAPASSADNSGGLRMAGSALPAAVLAAIRDQQSGESLDAAEEAQAMARGWEP